MQMISRQVGVRNEVVVKYCTQVLIGLLEQEPEDEWAIERAVWRWMLAVAPVVMSAMLARATWRAALADLAVRGLTVEEVSFRLEADYWGTLATTVGPVVFPWFVYRVKRDWGEAKSSPTRKAPGASAVVPLHPRARSTTMLLRLATLVGTHSVFGTAERLLETLTHGAVTLEDTTIASHCHLVGGLVEREHMYRTPAEIAAALSEDAMVDKEGRPILYVSTDAHNERLFASETWQSSYKNVHAIRLWYVSERTRRGVTLGGEFLVGDMTAVIEAFEELVRRGILPKNGKFGDLQALLVFVSDGMPWFQDRLVPQLGDNVQVVLDNKHLLKRLLDTLKYIFPKNSPRVQEHYRRLCRWVVGRAPGAPRQPLPRVTGQGTRPRIGPKQYFKQPRQFPQWEAEQLAQAGLPQHYGGALLYELTQIPEPRTDDKWDALQALLDYVSVRIEHTRYAEFIDRGVAISSAPIESLHRVAQTRLKLPGVTWTPEVAQTMLNLRVLHFMQKEPDFWKDSRLHARMRTRLDQRLRGRRNARELALADHTQQAAA